LPCLRGQHFGQGSSSPVSGHVYPPAPWSFGRFRASRPYTTPAARMGTRTSADKTRLRPFITTSFGFIWRSSRRLSPRSVWFALLRIMLRVTRTLIPLDDALHRPAPMPPFGNDGPVGYPWRLDPGLNLPLRCLLHGLESPLLQTISHAPDRHQDSVLSLAVRSKSSTAQIQVPPAHRRRSPARSSTPVIAAGGWT